MVACARYYAFGVTVLPDCMTASQYAHLTFGEIRENEIQRYFAKPNSLLMEKKVTPGPAKSACVKNWVAIMHSDSKTRKRTFNLFSTRNIT